MGGTELLRLEILESCNLFLNVDDMCRLATVLDMKFHGWNLVKQETALAVEAPAGERALKAYFVAKAMHGCSRKTLHGYQLEFDRMLNFIQRDVLSITTDDLRFYLAHLQLDLGLSKSSLDTKRCMMQSLFSWLRDNDYILKNPVAKIEKVKYQKNRRKPFTADEIERMRDAATGDIRATAIIDVLDSTGIRCGELVGLLREKVNPLTLEMSVHGKGDKTRTVYLSPRAMLHLNTYWATRDDDSPYAFVSTRRPHHGLTNKAVENLLAEIGKRAGVDHVFPHRFRHTTATMARQHGMPIELVQKLLGHSSVNTTMVYADVGEDELKTACIKYLAG